MLKRLRGIALLIAVGPRLAFPQPAQRDLAIDRTATQTFSRIFAVRGLADGRVLVSNPRAQQLWLLDSTLANGKIVLDSMPDVASRRFGAVRQIPHGALIPIAADSTVFLDHAARAYLVITPDGQVARSFAAPSAALAGVNDYRFDSQGRVLNAITEVFANARSRASRTKPVDSLQLIRTNSQGAREMLAWVKDGTHWGANPYANPVPVTDDWVVMPDNTVAIIRGIDFHIDWVSPDGSTSRSPRIQFDWRPIDEARKAALRDSLTAYYTRSPLRIGLSLSGPGSYRFYEAYVPEPMPMDRMPDFEPAFGDHSARVDGRGRIWIRVYVDGELPQAMLNQNANLISLGPQRGPALFYVIDRSGVLVDRFRLPDTWSLAGFGTGNHVFLSRQGPDGRLQLAHARIP